MEHLWDEEEEKDEKEKNVINPSRGNKRLFFDCVSRTKVTANIAAGSSMCTAHPLALGGSDRVARDNRRALADRPRVVERTFLLMLAARLSYISKPIF
jgi:hypothetical protein